MFVKNERHLDVSEVLTHRRDGSVIELRLTAVRRQNLFKSGRRMRLNVSSRESLRTHTKNVV